MNDLISRQAAIDAIKGLEFCHYMEFGEYIGEDTREVRLIRAEKAQDALQKLPSTQQWIPVEKKTPILPNIVLVCDSLGKILFDSYIDGSWTYCPYVVAWMPLPEPYKDKHED